MGFRNFCSTLALCLLILLLPAGPAGAVDEGDLDSSFNAGGQFPGVQITPIGTGDDAANAVAIQPDGKIVVAGYATSADKDIAVTRYLPTGVLDPSFDGDGIVDTTLGGGAEGANAVAIQPDGKIVVAGYGYNGTDEDFAVVRYLPNGSPDPSFSSDGVAPLGIGAGIDIADAIAIQPDGKIVVAGYFNNGVNDDMAVVRYMPSGALDPSFDGDGIQTTTSQLGSNADRATGIALQSDGKIVLVGSTTHANDNTTLVRYDTNGALDGSFGVGGIRDTDLGGNDRANAVAILPDDEIVVAAQFAFHDPDTDIDHTYPAALLYTSEGSYERFGAYYGYDGVGDGVAVQPDGKIVVVSNSSSFVDVMRFGPNLGADLDRQVSSGALPGAAAGVAIQSDGGIVIVGKHFNGSDVDFAVIRLIGDATAPTGGRIIGVPRYSVATRRTVSWNMSDVGSGVMSYDVERAGAKHSAGSLGPWSVAVSGTPNAYASFKASPGSTSCFRVRGHDYAGNVGAYSPPACEAVPLDERSMKAGGSWTKLAGRSFYLRTAMSSTVGGSKLSVSAQYRHLAVVVTTCRVCGKLGVYAGTTLLATVNLHTGSTRHERVIEVASAFPTQSGRIVLKQASPGKQVIVEGLAVSLD